MADFTEQSDDDFFGADCDDANSSNYMGNASLDKVGRIMYNDGYRLSKAQFEEETLQRGFNIGFASGMELGTIMGIIYGDIRMIRADREKDEIDNIVKEYFFRQVPGQFRLSQTDLSGLADIIERVGDCDLLSRWQNVYAAQLSSHIVSDV